MKLHISNTNLGHNLRHFHYQKLILISCMNNGWLDNVEDMNALDINSGTNIWRYVCMDFNNSRFYFYRLLL